MRVELKFFGIISAVALLSSCANYGYISENDVYYQKPTEIALEEDETDITSFNAFNARQRGAFRDEYVDPRLNQRSMRNNFALRASYMPFGMAYGWNNSPMAFHGMGYNSFYRYPYSYGFGMGGHYGSFANPYYYDMYAYGSSYHYNPYHYGYSNHYGYNPYYHGGHYGGYYGGSGSYYSGSTFGSNQGTYYYGHRSSSNSSSRRSSNYSNTLKKSEVTKGNVYSSGTKSVTERRDVNINKGNVVTGQRGTTGVSRGTVAGARNTAVSTQTRSSATARPTTAVVNRNYSPNASSQRTRVSNTSGRSSATTSPAHRTNSSVSPSRTATPAARSVPQSRPSTISRGSSTPRGSSTAPSRTNSGHSGRR